MIKIKTTVHNCQLDAAAGVKRNHMSNNSFIRLTYQTFKITFSHLGRKL